ncbi:MAG: NAD(P)-dependent oxidoreductase [Rariglobus sp.]
MNSPVPFTAPPSAPPRHERILVALTEQEKEMFLPGMDWGNHFTEALKHVELNTLNSADWEHTLREFQPTVLLSAWNTRPLPVSWLETPDCSLRYVCHLVGSARYLVPRVFLERGGLLTNWGSLAGDAVAEHALLLALASLRRQPEWRPLINGLIKDPGRPGTALLRTRTLHGRRVGIHGFGHVARSLVRLLQPFGVEIAAFSAGVPSAVLRAGGVIPCDSLRELAARSEIFFECEALTPRTHGSVDTIVIAALVDDALFVNVGRGPVVDEPALVAAAASERIQIALDVVVNDPIGPGSPFLKVPNAILSPHVAGPTYDQFPECGNHAIENMDRYLRGEPLDALITAELYDRST